MLKTFLLSLPAMAILCCVSILDAAAKTETLARAGGKDGMGIAAIVGTDAISSYDVNNRLRFIITMAKMSNTPDVIERMRPQVMRSLMDEHLQLQETSNNGIKVMDDEVAQSVAAIEQQRGMPPGTILKIMDRNNIPRSTFLEQVRAQIAWSKLLMKKVRPTIRVDDHEIHLAAKKMLLPQAQKVDELQIAVLQLPVDKPSRVQEVRRLANKLVGEVRAGASFQEVARQFSSSTATSGGKVDTFWVRPEQLAPAIAQRLRNARKDMVTDPVQSKEGFTIVKVYDTRSAKREELGDVAVAIKEILLRLKEDASVKEANVMLQIGEEVAKNPGSCQENGIASIDDIEDFDIEVNIYNNLMSELPPAVKVIAENLQVGDISTPFASSEGIRLYMLCDKKDGKGKLDKDRVKAVLFKQKMALEAQKYLRDLRRDVYTDVR